VSEELRERIEACARELGYTSKVNKQEVRKKMISVSVLYPCGSDSSIPGEMGLMDRCLEKTASDENVKLSRAILMNTEKHHAPDIRWITEKKEVITTDGVLVCGWLPEKKLRSVIGFFKVPVIGYGFISPQVDLDYLLDDGFRGIRKAVQHLAEKGCRDIIYLSEEEPGNGFLTDRYLGFYRAMHECGLIDVEEISAAAGQQTCGLAVLEERIEKGGIPQGVVASSDEMASSAVTLLKEAGCRIPGDVLVTGYREEAGGKGDHFFSSCVIPVNAHAARCLQLMRKRIERGGESEGVRFLECDFREGESTYRYI
jgi:DNA-binding LacI/PurR family transcriptional regulator